MSAVSERESCIPETLAQQHDVFCGYPNFTYSHFLESESKICSKYLKNTHMGVNFGHFCNGTCALWSLSEPSCEIITNFDFLVRRLHIILYLMSNCKTSAATMKLCGAEPQVVRQLSGIEQYLACPTFVLCMSLFLKDFLTCSPSRLQGVLYFGSKADTVWDITLRSNSKQWEDLLSVVLNVSEKLLSQVTTPCSVYKRSFARVG